MRKDDPRTDIFFAGCIFYQMLSGQPALAESRDRAQAGKARYSDDIKPILSLVAEAAAAAGDGRQQGDGI